MLWELSMRVVWGVGSVAFSCYCITSGFVCCISDCSGANIGFVTLHVIVSLAGVPMSTPVAQTVMRTVVKRYQNTT